MQSTNVICESCGTHFKPKPKQNGLMLSQQLCDVCTNVKLQQRKIKAHSMVSRNIRINEMYESFIEMYPVVKNLRNAAGEVFSHQMFAQHLIKNGYNNNQDVFFSIDPMTDLTSVSTVEALLMLLQVKAKYSKLPLREVSLYGSQLAYYINSNRLSKVQTKTGYRLVNKMLDC